MIILPSAQAFWYADKNAQEKLFPYRYELGVEGAVIRNEDIAVPPAFYKSPACPSQYTIVNPYWKEIEEELPCDALRDMASKAAFYDTTQWAGDKVSLFDLARQWGQGKGPAFIDQEDIDKPAGANASRSGPDHMVKVYNGFLKDFSSDSNGFSFSVALERPQFFVYNAPYSPQWRVWVDGQEKILYRANGAFLGTWVPSGRHTITFRYGGILDQIGAWAALLFFTCFLGWVIVERKSA